jgi:hypothetical protein
VVLGDGLPVAPSTLGSRLRRWRALDAIDDAATAATACPWNGDED